VILGFSELPDSPGKFATILSGYHGSSQSGQLVILDLNKGFYEDEGITQRISGEGKEIEVKYMDGMTMDEPQQLLQPATVTDNTFLVSGWDTRRDRRIGIYLAQTDDTLELLYAEDGKALIEVTPIQSRP